MNGIAFLILAFVCNGAANVLLKLGADKGITTDLSLGVVRLISLHAYLLAGLGFFALNVLLYIAALRVLPLSVAYPVMVGMSFIIVSAASIFLLNESIAWQQITGYCLILAGVMLAVGYAR